MFDLMPNVWSSKIIVKTFRIILDDDLTFSFAFVLSLDILFFNVLVQERLDK
jgi:hypothetical protein